MRGMRVLCATYVGPILRPGDGVADSEQHLEAIYLRDAVDEYEALPFGHVQFPQRAHSFLEGAVRRLAGPRGVLCPRCRESPRCSPLRRGSGPWCSCHPPWDLWEREWASRARACRTVFLGERVAREAERDGALAHAGGADDYKLGEVRGQSARAGAPCTPSWRRTAGRTPNKLAGQSTRHSVYARAACAPLLRRGRRAHGRPRDRYGW